MASITLRKLATILACSGVAASLPAPNPQNPPSAETVKSLELYSQYAAASYCRNNTEGSPGTPVACSSGSCPRVFDNGAKVLGGFLNFGLFYSTCLMAVDPTEKNLVLSCRGAVGPGFITALLTTLKPCSSICPDCNCHAGFYDSWLTIRDRVTSLVQSAQQEYPGYALIFTGHSLGSAQAFYAAAEFRTNGTASTLYTYGQPHTGDLTLAQYVTDQGNNYRVTHTDDPAPRLGSPVLGYRHISPEYWIFNDEPEFHVRPEDMAIIPGFNNATGDQGQGGFDAAAHMEYFQSNISSCYTTG